MADSNGVLQNLPNHGLRGRAHVRIAFLGGIFFSTVNKIRQFEEIFDIFFAFAYKLTYKLLTTCYSAGVLSCARRKRVEFRNFLRIHV